MDLNDFAFQDVFCDSLQSVSDLSSTSGNSTTFDDMMKKLSKHIEKFQEKEFRELYFFQLPRVVRASDRVEIVTGLGTYMCELLQTHKDSVINLEIVINILNVILKTTAEDELMIPVPKKVLFDLAELLMYERSTRAIPGLIECLKLQIQNSKDVDLVTKIWEKVFQGINENKSQLQAAEILLDFSDYFQEIIPNFFKHKEIIRLIQELLLEDSICEQKYGLHLLGMVIQILKRAEPLSLWELDYSRENHLFWNTYFELMKAVIENRLEALQPLLETIMSNGFKGVAYEIWMNIFFVKMLKSTNVSIKRLAVEWILERFKWVDLKADLQKSFMETLNNLHLYNYEEYFLPEKNIGKFLNCDCKQILESLAHLRWKSVPFHFWLKQLSIHKHKALDLQNLSKELLLKIAINVREVKHVAIRRLTIEVFEELFDDILTSVSVGDHVTLMETLYEIGDYSDDLDLRRISVLFKKFSIATDEEITTETFSKRFYEIICLQYYNRMDEFDYLELLLEVLKNFPKEKHSWLRFLLVFDTPANRVSEISEFCRLTYDLDLQAMAKLTLNEISNEFLTKLGCKEEEMDFIRTKSLNFLADHRLENYTELEEFQKTFADFLELGDDRTLLLLSRILRRSNHKLLPKDFEMLMNKIKTNLDMLESGGQLFELIENISIYCKENYPDEQTQHAENILNLDLSNFEIAKGVYLSNICLNEDSLKTGLLLGEPEKGERRLEGIYFVQISNYSSIEILYVRKWYIRMLQRSDHIHSIVAQLLKLNKELSANVNCQSNQELSLEYRQQMRIACTVSTLICCPDSNKKLSCSDELWEILLEQKHRPSVRYLYELSTAMNSPDMQRIKEQLKMALQYDESRQSSVISVAFCYCALRLKSILLTDIDEVVNLLWTLTMNANPKSRLHAQMAIVLILEECSEETQQLAHNARLLTNIILSMGNHFAELSENVRFIMPRILEAINKASWQAEWDEVCDAIFYITNEPYDEYKEPSNEIINSLEKSRLLYAADISKNCEPVEARLKSFENANNEHKSKIQNDNSISCQDLLSDTFVVASLVENVEPITRHCKDAGFEHLILAPEATAESPDIDHAILDFAEDSHHINANDLKMFLSKKRDKGYKIIGAEHRIEGFKPLQFKFAGKFVLLLGHEKNGIPANLLDLVDFCIPLNY